MLGNNQHQYGWVSIILHWTSAIAIFGLFALGLWMVELTYYDTWYHRAPALHKGIGIVVLGATVLRLLWRIAQPRPALLSAHAWENMLAHLGHTLLYLLLFVVLLSGYLIPSADGHPVAVFDWFELPPLMLLGENQEDIAGTIHRWTAYALILLATGHAAAAFKHHFFDHNDTLLRMLRVKPRK